MTEKKRYTLLVRRKRVEVSQEVYKAYYQAYERERYASKQALDMERSIERFAEDGVSVEYQYATSLPSLEDQVLHEQEKDKLNAALCVLRKDERMLIEELFFKGKSERQIALEYGIPRMTICSRKHGIIKKLKELLEN